MPVFPEEYAKWVSETDGLPPEAGILSEFEKVHSFHECQIAEDLWQSSFQGTA
jgi:hypothetical protein